MKRVTPVKREKAQTAYRVRTHDLRSITVSTEGEHVLSFPHCVPSTAESLAAVVTRKELERLMEDEDLLPKERAKVRAALDCIVAVSYKGRGQYFVTVFNGHGQHHEFTDLRDLSQVRVRGTRREALAA